MIDRLAELRRKDVLTEDEFTAKKSELLARLRKPPQDTKTTKRSSLRPN